MTFNINDPIETESGLNALLVYTWDNPDVEFHHLVVIAGGTEEWFDDAGRSTSPSRRLRNIQPKIPYLKFEPNQPIASYMAQIQHKLNEVIEYINRDRK